jgi:methyl-accepting chemotaxis protein
MNKTTSIAALTAAFIGMGIAMPQCPGEKAMQDQVDQLKATQITMTQKLQAMDGQVKQSNAMMETMKTAITQLAGAVQSQSDAMKRLDDAVKEIQTKLAAGSSKAKGGKKKGH